jgi:galactokinase/mevalonate kinase-like predicted kinase
MVDDAIELMVAEHEPIRRIGEFVHESWMLKPGLATSITNDRVDQIYQAAMAVGAAGGKLLGAGGGGFLAFIMRPAREAAVSNALRALIQVSVDLDPDGAGLWFTSLMTSISQTTTNLLVPHIPTRPVDRQLRPGRGAGELHGRPG